MGNTAIWEDFGVDPLLLHVERSQMRSLELLVRIPPRNLFSEVFRAQPSGRRPQGRPRTRWGHFVSWLAWESLVITPEELDEVAEEREVWAYLPPPNPL